MDPDRLAEQRDYYEARADEYDDWFYRRGRYDRGPEANAAWFGEVATLQRELAAFAPFGRTVELACGTGLWTRWLAPMSDSLVAVDASPRMIGLNRQRVHDAAVEYVEADLFGSAASGPVGARRFDTAVFCFWLSHVPPARFDGFWRLVDDLLEPGGRFFLADSLYTEQSTAADHRLEGAEATEVTRRLDDGREYRIVKVFHDPAELARRLRADGWQDVRVEPTGRFFLHGAGRKPTA